MAIDVIPGGHSAGRSNATSVGLAIDFEPLDQGGRGGADRGAGVAMVGHGVRLRCRGHCVR